MSEKKYILREFYKLCDGGFCSDLLNESDKQHIKQGGMILTGIAQRADARNGNGRIYPRRVLEREVENYKKLVRENRALGEIDHPDSVVVNLKNSSHMITEIWWNGDDVMVKLKVLSGTPGQQLRSLVNDGVAIGLSSRGLGSVRETREGTIVEDDFVLACVDVVSEPSTQGAFVNLMESKANLELTKPDRIFRCLNEILLKE